MCENPKETCYLTTAPTVATKLKRIIASIPDSIKQNIHLSIDGVSHRMPYNRLPPDRKARNRLLLNTSSITLHDIPIWSLRSGDVLTDIEEYTTTHPVPLIQLPISIQMIIDVPSSSRHEGDIKECTNFVVDISHTAYAFDNVNIPVSIVSLIALEYVYCIIFITAIGSLYLCAVSMDLHSLIAKVSLGYNVTMCSMIQNTLYFLSRGRLYAIDVGTITNMYRKSKMQSYTSLQSQIHIQPHCISNGVKTLTHISADCTEVHAVSSTGTVYSITSNGLARVFGFKNSTIISFIVISSKKITYIVLRANMIAYLYTSQGDVLATYSAVLQVQQTVDRQGAILVLQGLFVIVYGDAAYSITLKTSFSRVLFSNTAGGTLTIIYTDRHRCFKLIATLPTLSKSQLKRTHLQSYINIPSAEVKQIKFSTQSSFNTSLLCALAAYSLQSCSVYLLAFSGDAAQTCKTEVNDCVFGHKCSQPSLCSLCRCSCNQKTLLPIPSDQSLMDLNWYMVALTEAGKLLDYDRAIQIIKIGMNCDKIRTELMDMYTTSSLAPFLHQFMFNLAHLEVLVRTGCSFVAIHIIIIIIQHFGASAPWLTALACQDTNISRRHLRDLALLFSFHLNFFGIPILDAPTNLAQCGAVTEYPLNCETAEN